MKSLAQAPYLSRKLQPLFILFTLAISLVAGWADVLLSCAGDPGGDLDDRGFYIPSYPGNSLDSARLVFSSFDPGVYTMTLTVRKGTYDGPVLGSDSATVTILGAYPQDVATTFTFPSVRIAEGSRVCFILSRRSGPGRIYFSVAGSGGCTSVIETEGTTPPLDTFRRNGVNLVIRGEDTLIVAPGESIQAAINAAAVGETVVVDPGTYHENIRLRPGVNVVGAGQTATILQGLGNSNVVTALNVTDARMEGFKILGSGTDPSLAGVVITGGSVEFSRNWIYGNINGMRIQGNSSAIVRNNLFERNGSSSDPVLNYGLICLSSTPLIANNVIFNTRGAGMYFAWADSTGAQVINNTVANNSDYGIWCYSGANVTIKNNIVARNNTGISASAGAAPIISFNDVFGNTWLNYNPQTGGVAAPGPGDISVDPLFDTASVPPYHLSFASPCINAGDPNPLFNDIDGTRNDMGAFGGPSGVLGGIGPSVTTGFLFNNLGKIPTSEITKTGASAGLANVSPAVASALSIYQYADAPFGGNLWVHGLFGSSDASVRYYKILAAPWSGGSPPAAADFQPVTDPLSKIRYTIGPGGVVTSTLVSIGPDSNGMYQRTESGYWAHPDLKIIWNTLALPNGRYDLICKAYNVALAEVPLPANTLSRITVRIDNSAVEASINAVKDMMGVTIPECGIIPLATATQNLQFDITASHPGGFLRDFTLDVLYGRNRYGGVIAADRYVGSHDSAPPTWFGVTGAISNSAPAHASGALLPWTSCAYQFRLTAWARTTDGFGHLYYKTFSDHYSLSLGFAGGGTSSCAADLDHDGDVDGADLVIFASQFGSTNCIVTPSP
jgi:parallel beta-helix repeat protein